MRILLLLLFSLFSFAQANINSILKQYRFSQIKFEQETYFKDLNEKQKFKGSIYIQKSTLKLEYIQPYKQIIFVKNKKVYIYSPQENQLVITNQNRDFAILNVLRILSGEDKIDKFFRIKLLDKDIYLLVPKKKSSIKQIKLFTNGNKITKIEVQDKDGNILIVKLNKQILNKPLKLDLKIPNNVDVLDYSK